MAQPNVFPVQTEVVGQTRVVPVQTISANRLSRANQRAKVAYAGISQIIINVICSLFNIGELIAASFVLTAINEVEEFYNENGAEYENAGSYKAAAGWLIFVAPLAMIFHVIAVIILVLYMSLTVKKHNKLFTAVNALICVLFVLAFLAGGVTNAIYASENGSDLCNSYRTSKDEFCKDLERVVTAEGASAALRIAAGMAEELLSKIGTKSMAWNYFGLKKGSDGNAIDDGGAICRTCRRRVLAKYGNTSNLMSHLKINHPKLYEDAMKTAKTSRSKSVPVSVGQSTIEETIERTQKYERKGKRWKELTDSITYCIAKDCLPINIVEGAGFKRMINAFDSRYEIPSRNHFSRIALPSLSTSVNQQVRKKIGTLQYFSATTDMWSSIGMQPYMSYTIHYIDSEWKLQNICLQTQFLPEDHTGINLADAMEAALGLWELDATKQVCLTADNGSNIVRAAEILEWERLSCFGHNLHLSITKAIKDDSRCNRALGVCRKIVSSLKMSWKRKRELTKTQLNLNIKQHSLVADCPTRWGSMAKMVSRILEQKEAVRLVLGADRSTSNIVPTWQDLDVLQAIDQAISPLSSLTDILSGEQYVTVSAVLPILCILETDLLKEQDTDAPLTKDIKHRIIEDITKRYTEAKLGDKVIEILRVASFLDPRFKMKYLEQLQEGELCAVKQKVIDECMSVCSEIQEQGETTQSADSIPEPSAPKKRNLGTLFKNHEIKIREEQEHTLSGDSVSESNPISIEERHRQKVTKEVGDYLTASRLDFEEDPLLWWKAQPFSYPILGNVARKYLCVCATSSASERLFSTAGNIVSSFRATLKPDKVDMLVFLSKNL